MRPACLFVLAGAVGVGAGAGLGGVDGCRIDAAVGAGFFETGLVMAGERRAVERVRPRRVGRWLRRWVLERP